MIFSFDGYFTYSLSDSLHFKYSITSPCFSRTERVTFKLFTGFHEIPLSFNGAWVESWITLPQQTALWLVWQFSTVLRPVQVCCTVFVYFRYLGILSDAVPSWKCKINYGENFLRMKSCLKFCKAAAMETIQKIKRKIMNKIMYIWGRKLK